ncbi:hypothetical protein [Aliikangiella sp. IMCC44632]
MKNAYKLEKRITQIRGALLHGDGSTFKEALGINPASFGRDGGDNHMEFSLFDFNVENIKKVVALWNDLPPDEPMRCFTPGYRLEFYSGSSLIMKAAICWACNWVQVLKESGQEPSWYSFNGESKQASELLELLRGECKKCI